MLVLPRALAALTIFASAFLLFTVEPLFAKRILPWFGGSAAVWTTCLVFYQTALLFGYLYARLLTSRLRPSSQAFLHIALLALALLFLPVGPSNRWQPLAAGQPAGYILWMMAATLGLPFMILSATSPLLQQWLARAGEPMPYRLFALSNFASLAALLAYPLLIEPHLDLSRQRLYWSAGFVIFALACGSCAFLARSSARAESSSVPEPLPVFRRLYWFSLAACGSMLLLAVTNHITQNVAAVPLLWVLPLAIYLLSFVIGFSSGAFYRRSLWLRLLAMALGLLAYSVYNIATIEAIQISLPIFLGGLFVCCVFCQGELFVHRPSPAGLTEFYLIIAAGAAAGAIFVGIFAPYLFTGVYELPFTLVVTALLALFSTWDRNAWPVRLLWLGVSCCMLAVFIANLIAYRENSLLLVRSFYGSLRVVQSPRAGPEQIRTLFHGTIQHGAELVWADRQRRPLTYYGRDSGVGIVLRECLPEGPRRVGVVGLGAGTLATFGRTADTFRFYEINPQVITIANSLFFFLRESAAHIEIAEGDARLSLEQERQPFDLLVLDAFSGDAIPVHLLTREALALYLRLLKPGGVIAFHVSNNYLALAPVVRQLAGEVGYPAIEVRNHDDPENYVFAADWVLVTQSPAILENAAVRLHSAPIARRDGLRPWTDDFNNLLEILKWPATTSRSRW